MTRKNSNRTTSEIKAMMGEDGDFLRPIVRTVIEEFLEAEMTEAIGAQKGERVEGRSLALEQFKQTALGFSS
jgi:putative transposase